MATTTNYGWTTPNDTDLVKDGAAAIRTLGSSVDTTTKNLNPETTLGDIAYRSSTSNTNTRLGIGSSGQVLTVAAGVPSWATPTVGDITEVSAGTGISVASGTGPIPVITNTVATAIDAKGDLIVGTGADAFARLAVGTNGQVLTADSSEATGLKFATPAAGGFVGVKAQKSATQSLTNNTDTAITFAGTDTFDTDGFHDPATNNTRFTIPAGKAGYYLISGNFGFATNGTGARECYFNLNGSFGYNNVSTVPLSSTATVGSFSVIANLSVADYIELILNQTSGGALNANTSCIVSMQFLGA